MNYNSLFKIIWVYIVVCLCTISCKRDAAKIKEKEWKIYSTDFIKRHIGNKVVFPNTYWEDNVIEPVRKSHLGKILVNIDIECSVCLMKFAFWKQFQRSMIQKYGIDIPIVVFVNGNRKHVSEVVHEYWSGYWVYDDKDFFLEQNDLFDDRFQTLLVDSNDYIKLIGNPMHNVNLTNLYEKEIALLYKATKR